MPSLSWPSLLVRASHLFASASAIYIADVLRHSLRVTYRSGAAVQTTRTSPSLSIFVIAAVFYATFYSINDALIHVLAPIPGADFFRLSSGVKLMLVLLTGWVGAAAIASFCFLWSALFVFPDHPVLAAQVAIAGGAAPWLSCLAFHKHLWPDLSRLNWQTLFQLSLAYAAVNSVLREGILVFHLQHGELLGRILHAFASDLCGIFLALYVSRFFLMFVSLPKPPSR